MNAIGVIDTIGFVGSVEALDVCLKTADVEFVNLQKMTGGIVSIVIKGGVGAVNASVSAGVEASRSIGGYLRHTVIARMDDQTDKLMHKNCNAEEIDIKESLGKVDSQTCIDYPLEGFADKTAITAMENETKDSENSDKALIQEETSHSTETEKRQESIAEDDSKSISEKEAKKKEELNRMTVSKLRKLARKMKIDNMKINAARKSEIISIILNEMRNKEALEN